MSGTLPDHSIAKRPPLSVYRAHSGPCHAAGSHSWQLVSTRPAAAPLPAPYPLPLGALQQRALGQAAPVAGSCHRRPVAGVGHAASSLCATREARGSSRRRQGANLRGGISPGSPAQRVREGGCAAGLGVRGEEEARARVNPAQMSAEAGPRAADLEGAEQATRKRGQQPRVLASGQGVARAADREWGRCQDAGGRGGALPGLRAAGAGRWRHLDVGPWSLAPFP